MAGKWWRRRQVAEEERIGTKTMRAAAADDWGREKQGGRLEEAKIGMGRCLYKAGRLGLGFFGVCGYWELWFVELI